MSDFKTILTGLDLNDEERNLYLEVHDSLDSGNKLIFEEMLDQHLNLAEIFVEIFQLKKRAVLAHDSDILTQIIQKEKALLELTDK